MSNGKVLVAGDFNEFLQEVGTYHPASKTWKLTGGLLRKRLDHTATLLKTGMVLVAGGSSSGRPTELYDPSSERWVVTGVLPPHAESYRNIVPGGSVLVAGGYYFTASAEIYDPPTATWTVTGSLITARSNHTATLLPDGNVLIVGRLGSGFIPLASVEIRVRGDD